MLAVAVAVALDQQEMGQTGLDQQVVRRVLEEVQQAPVAIMNLQAMNAMAGAVENHPPHLPTAQLDSYG